MGGGGQGKVGAVCAGYTPGEECESGAFLLPNVLAPHTFRLRKIVTVGSQHHSYYVDFCALLMSVG